MVEPIFELDFASYRHFGVHGKLVLISSLVFVESDFCIYFYEFELLFYAYSCVQKSNWVVLGYGFCVGFENNPKLGVCVGL